MKLCHKCCTHKSFTSFHKNKSKKDGYSTPCIECKKSVRRRPSSSSQQKLWRAANPTKSMIYNARQRARRGGMAFDLADDDVTIPASCPVLGIPIVAGGNRRSDGSPTLDRIDNKQGYVRGNVIVVSWLANRLKSDATIEQLRAIVSFYENLK